MRNPVKRSKTSITVAPKKDQYQSRALEKGLQALEELAYAPAGLTLLDFAARLSLTKASAFRIIRTLDNLSYITRGADGRYLLSGASNRQLPLRSVQLMLKHGDAPLRELVREHHETASMAALYENHIEVVMVVESPHLVRMANTVGRIIPPHGSSLGKVITAQVSPEKREHLLRTYGTAPITEHTVTDGRAILQQLDRVKSNGHAEDWEESTPGGVCFAAPLLGLGNTVLGAISISMPRMRLEGEKHQAELVNAVRRTAQVISRKISSDR